MYMHTNREKRKAKIVSFLRKMPMSSRGAVYMPKEVCEEYAERLLTYDPFAKVARGVEWGPGDRVVIDYRVEHADGKLESQRKHTFVTERIEYDG